MFLVSTLLPLVVVGGLTAVIAGTAASAVVFRSLAPRPMLINGIAGTALAYPAVAFTPLPGLATLQVNAVVVYPIWSIAGALFVAVLWRLALAALPPEPSEAERDAERIRRARARAASYRRDRQ